MLDLNLWIVIVFVAIAFTIFVANAVYLSGIIKSLSSGNSNLKLSKGGAKAFLWIDSILAGLLGILLIYLMYVVFTQKKSLNAMSTVLVQ